MSIKLAKWAKLPLAVYQAMHDLPAIPAESSATCSCEAVIEMDEDRIDRIAASHGDGEHYSEVG